MSGLVITKTSQLKVGDTIEWAKPNSRYVPSKDGEGVVLELRGKNILAGIGGWETWLFLPDLAWVKKI